MTELELDKYLLTKSDTYKDYPFGEGVAVYKIRQFDGDKMFALIKEGSQPVNLSLKCDPILASDLREKYESVMPGYHLNKKHWITVVCSGQLSNDEILALIDHSYQLIAG